MNPERRARQLSKLRRASLRIALRTIGVQPSSAPLKPSAIRLQRHRSKVSRCVAIRPSRNVNAESMRLRTKRPVTENV